jgi:hypothetical protein
MPQPQGGWLPSWQTTVVDEPGGTITVVLAGGFGLPLLMQPQSIAEATTSADIIFMVFVPPRCAIHTGSLLKPLPGRQESRARGSMGRRPLLLSSASYS